MKFTRLCPSCGKKLFYLNYSRFEIAKNSDKICSKCRHNKYLDFNSARVLVSALGIQNQDRWQEFCKKEDFRNLLIPTNPDVFYRNGGWKSWSDWLGNSNNYINRKGIEYLSYTECKNYIAENFRETKNKTWWINLDKSLLPINIPKRPDAFYKNNGWVSWEIFLDSPLSPRSKSIMILPFDEAKNYVRSLNLLSESDYYDHIEKNGIAFLPMRPDSKYKERWKGFIDFLGVKSKRLSTGEDRIESILTEFNIEFIREKKFDGCINKKSLPFDFYLPCMNICIEYDGEFHYKPQKHFGGQKTFERIRKNDQIKSEWCSNNGIKLIRIPYNKKWRIREFLMEEFGIYGKSQHSQRK